MRTWDIFLLVSSPKESDGLQPSLALNPGQAGGVCEATGAGTNCCSTSLSPTASHVSSSLTPHFWVTEEGEVGVMSCVGIPIPTSPPFLLSPPNHAPSWCSWCTPLLLPPSLSAPLLPHIPWGGAGQDCRREVGTLLAL